MGGCTAVNCTNSRRKGIRLFRFPKDETRRKIWLQNCRRDKWVPTNSSGLCEIHFEESQFEQHRQGGIKKLKSNAIPTLFNVPNPPRLLETKRKSLYKTITDCSGQVGSENAIDTSQNESILSRHKIILGSNDVTTVATNSAINIACLKETLSTYSIEKELEKTRAELKRIQDENDNMKTFIQEMSKIEEEKRLTQLEIECLKKEVQKSNELLHKFLNDDQISALSTPTRQWANDTIYADKEATSI
ncbi:THAP domain-containing protein 2-like [Acyrthosiphon pisum]|uniref:THAP-type domain-containing protein n=1 Tax=Acyrthosiphon pisum TaxID=7029 RepID=A0A8R2JRW5_ACYPI|nr:THAP domain-containing protein 2-like [Acyrthosiphon pisum]